MLTLEILQQAWQQVETKNKAGGIDDISVEWFAENANTHLKNIFSFLQSQSYLPQPYLKIEIPKNETEKRNLGLASIQDKIVQEAILLLIEPKIDAIFVNNSYAYRKKKGPQRALTRVIHTITNEGNIWLLKCDIDDYFDNVPHKLLFDKLKPFVEDAYYLQLIQTFCKMAYVTHNLKWQSRNKGLPQGAILSPILSNLFLHSFDKYVLQHTNGYVRYADDFVIFTKSEAQALDLKERVIRHLKNKLQLRLNLPVRIQHSNTGFKYLGVWINNAEISIQAEKAQKLKEKITAAFKHREFPESYFNAIQGIRNYYGKLIPAHYLIPLDKHIELCWIKYLSDKKKYNTKKAIKAALTQLLWLSDLYRQNADVHNINLINTIYSNNRNLTIESPEQAIAIRKREYQKMANLQNHLFVRGFGKSISYSKGKIVVKQKGRVLNRFSLKNIKYLSVEGESISISTKVIHYCAENNIAIDFVETNGQPQAKLYSATATNFEIWVHQTAANVNQKAFFIAKQIVLSKIKNQLKTIKYFAKYAIKKEADLAIQYPITVKRLNNIIIGLKSNIDVQPIDDLRSKLMGYEGAASGSYWQFVKMMVDEETNFTHREHKGASDLVNSMLNYGYAILYRHIWSSVLQQGLHPGISYLHKASKKQGSLVFDLIEPFRQPIVDRAIIATINRGSKLSQQKNLLTTDTRNKIIKAVDRRLFAYGTYLKQKKHLYNIIHQQTQQLKFYLQGNTNTFIPYEISKW